MKKITEPKGFSAPMFSPAFLIAGLAGHFCPREYAREMVRPIEVINQASEDAREFTDVAECIEDLEREVGQAASEIAVYVDGDAVRAEGILQIALMGALFDSVERMSVSLGVADENGPRPEDPIHPLAALGYIQGFGTHMVGSSLRGIAYVAQDAPIKSLAKKLAAAEMCINNPVGYDDLGSIAEKLASDSGDEDDAPVNVRGYEGKSTEELFELAAKRVTELPAEKQVQAKELLGMLQLMQRFAPPGKENLIGEGLVKLHQSYDAVQGKSKPAPTSEPEEIIHEGEVNGSLFEVLAQVEEVIASKGGKLDTPARVELVKRLITSVSKDGKTGAGMLGIGIDDEGNVKFL